jgi:methionyl-tRNA formyltransferase
MKLVFCGTPEFAVPTLEALLQHGHEIPLVLTQPDRPAGRKMELQQSAVKRTALTHSLRVLQPEKIKTNAELRAALESLNPDAIIVVACSCRASATSTCTVRCCQSIAAPHRFNGPSRTASPRRA